MSNDAPEVAMDFETIRAQVMSVADAFSEPRAEAQRDSHPLWHTPNVESGGINYQRTPLPDVGFAPVDYAVPVAPIMVAIDDPMPVNEPRPVVLADKNLIMYVRMLEATAGVVLSEQERTSLALLGVKRTINRAFFRALPAASGGAPMPFPEEEVANAYLKERESTVKAEIDRAKHDIQGNINNAMNQSRSAMGYFETAAKCRLRLTALQGKPDSPLAEIAKILADPFFTFHGLKKRENGEVYGAEFITASVILVYQNKQHGIDITLDLGRFRFEWLFAGVVKVHPHTGNILASNHYHPHLSGGNICLGNAADAYKTAVAEGKISTQFQILQSILLSYNPDSPYIDITTFQKFIDFKTCDKSKLETYWAERNDAWIYNDKYGGTYHRIGDESTVGSRGGDEEDETVLIRCRIYQQRYVDLGLDVEPIQYAVCDRNRQYIPIAEDVIYGRY